MQKNRGILSDQSIPQLYHIRSNLHKFHIGQTARPHPFDYLSKHLHLYNLPEFCSQFQGKILNIHPSLLPKFKGLNTYQRVLESGDEYHGSTVHFVTAELDSGPLILQYRTRIKPDDDPERLKKRVQHGEHQIYPMAIRWFAEGSLKMVDGETMLMGKRMTRPKVLEET